MLESLGPCTDLSTCRNSTSLSIGWSVSALESQAVQLARGFKGHVEQVLFDASVFCTVKNRVYPLHPLESSTVLSNTAIIE